MFDSLTSYAGGKRRLLPAIFRQMPPPREAPVLIDVFLGGGSVSLYGKARGYRIITNDIADRSVLPGRALIENDRVRLDHEDLMRLFKPVHEPGFVAQEMVPGVFPSKHGLFLDRALQNARKLQGPKRWLSLLLCIKLALRLRPLGTWGARRIIEQMDQQDYEGMRDSYIRDVFARAIPRHPLRMAENLRQAINRGVFSSGQENIVHQMDVFDFLPSVKGDIAYFDCPYANTSPYEKACRPLDEMLAGKRLKVKPNAFSTEHPAKTLPRLFEAAGHIPLWIISYGNQVVGLSELVDLVRRHRPVIDSREIKHAHMTGLATRENRNRNRELLVVARRK